MGLAKADSICFAAVCQTDDAVMVACSEGKVVTFPVSEIRVSGRSAAGVRGKKLSPGMPAALTSLPCCLKQVTPIRALAMGP